MYVILINILLTLAMSFLGDRLFGMILKNSAKYFFMHTILNSYICYVTYNTTVSFLLNPINDFSFHSPDGQKSASIIIGFHLYHILTEKLNLEDKTHHIVTVFITGGSALIKPCGNILAAVNFIMCGLPGGLDYFMLVLVKYNIITKLTEKYFNRWLNLLIRMPGMMLCAWYVILNIQEGTLVLKEYYIALISVLLMTINSVYYCNKTVGNYHVRYYQSLIKNKEHTT